MTSEPGRGFDRKPSKTIVVPDEYRPTIRRGDLERLTSEWHAETGCEVRYHQDGKALRFAIFGSGVKLNQTTQIINKWIERARNKTPASSAWAKKRAFDPNQWYYEEISTMEAERKSKFKGPKPEDVDIPYKVVVKWPQELTQYNDKIVTPRDAFGNKLEGLDSIRVDDEVYITLLPNRDPLWQVEISGFTQDHVDTGRSHYLNMIDKIQLKTLYGSYSLNIILDGNEGGAVALTSPPRWWPDHSMLVPHLKYHDLISGDVPGTFRNETLDPNQLAKLQSGIERALEKVRFQRGSYDFVIHLGALALKDVKRDDKEETTHPINLFQRGIDRGTIQYLVQKWAVDHDLGDQFLDRLMAADYLLEPVRPFGGFFGVVPATLKETQPTFRGTWVLKNPDTFVWKPKPKPAVARNPGQPRLNRTPITSPHSMSEAAPESFIVVQIDWTEDNGTYEKMRPYFFSLQPGQTNPEGHMDINLIELGDSRAWHFALESMVRLQDSTVSTAITGFAKNVQLNKPHALKPTERPVAWSTGSGIVICGGRVDRVHTFGIKKTGYRVEASMTWFQNMNGLPCWSVAVRHKEWATTLNELERLPSGARADWGDTTTTFLPDDGGTSADPDTNTLSEQLQYMFIDGETLSAPRRGIKLLLNKLLQLSRVISGDTSAPTAPSLGSGLAFTNSRDL